MCQCSRSLPYVPVPFGYNIFQTKRKLTKRTGQVNGGRRTSLEGLRTAAFSLRVAKRQSSLVKRPGATRCTADALSSSTTTLGGEAGSKPYRLTNPACQGPLRICTSSFNSDGFRLDPGHRRLLQRPLGALRPAAPARHAGPASDQSASLSDRTTSRSRTGTYRPGILPPPVPPAERVCPPRPGSRNLAHHKLGRLARSAALLLAGVFLVRYAVEQEFLGPAARCGLAALLGLILLAGAEFLHRHEGPPLVGPFPVDQAPSGLAAGGTAILFGSAYGAGPFFGLLPPLLALAAMAAASLVALGSALRYGPLTAATGIAGAFATPALVATQSPSLPGLFAYLLIVSAAACRWFAAPPGLGSHGPPRSPAPSGWFSPPSRPRRLLGRRRLRAGLGRPQSAAAPRRGTRPTGRPAPGLGALRHARRRRPGAGNLRPRWAPRPRCSCCRPSQSEGVAEPRLDRLPWVAASLCLLTLLVWTVPAWMPIGVAIHAEGLVQAILPRAWVPQSIMPFHRRRRVRRIPRRRRFWLERRAPNPLPWAAWSRPSRS